MESDYEWLEKVHEWNKTELGQLFHKYEICWAALCQSDKISNDERAELAEALRNERYAFLKALRGF